MFGPAGRSDSTPEQRCARYRYEYLLPAVVDPASRRILLPIGGLIGAVTMPHELGRRVLAGLRVRMLAGPVVEHPHSQRWTFLTGPGHTLAEPVNADLLRLRVSVAGPGNDVVLPCPDDEQLGLWHWVSYPESLSDFPAQSAVLATTRAMSTSTPW
ncbi:MAG: hypothetical protein ACR2GH_22880 [Pseudonocardia sp.]